MIRPASATDAREIAKFYADVRSDTVPLIHPVDDVAHWISTNLIPRNSSFVWEQDGELLGWVDVHEGWLDQLYCRRGFIGVGLGKILLDFAKKRSVRGLQLYTFQVNGGARRFYAREGFAEIAFGDGSGNEEGQPDVLMEWRPL